MQAVPAGVGDRSLTAGAGQGGMPTILRTEGFRLYFFSHDRKEPPHVHIDRGGASAKLWLEPITVARNSGFAPQELGDMLRLVRERREELLEAWHAHFGTGRPG
jgi:hypothetical protein